MVVCICNNVNSSTIQSAVEAGACSVEAVRDETAASSCCGKCQFKVHAIVQDTLADMSFPQQASSQ